MSHYTMLCIIITFWSFLFYPTLCFSFLYFGGIFNNNIIPFLLVGYQMIIVTRLSTSWLSIYMYHLIFNTPSWTYYCQLNWTFDSAVFDIDIYFWYRHIVGHIIMCKTNGGIVDVMVWWAFQVYMYTLARAKQYPGVKPKEVEGLIIIFIFNFIQEKPDLIIIHEGMCMLFVTDPSTCRSHISNS